MMKYHINRGVTLWATQDYQNAITEAKKYVIKYGLTGKVKVIRHQGQLLIVTKEPIILEEVHAQSSCVET